MNFHNEMKQNIPAVQILHNARELMEQVMKYFSDVGEEILTTLAEHGVAIGEHVAVYVS